MKKYFLLLIVIAGLLLWYKLANSEEVLLDKKGRNINEFIQEDKINLVYTSAAIDTIEVLIINKTWHDINVIIPAGTIFTPKADSIQNMISREPIQRFFQKDRESIIIPVACINFHKKAPSNKNLNFDVSNEVNHLLLNFITFLNAKDKVIPYGVFQSAVWIITDDVGYNQILSLRRIDHRFLAIAEFAPSTITFSDIQQSINLLQEFGYDIKNRRIYSDSPTSYFKLESPKLKEIDFATEIRQTTK